MATTDPADRGPIDSRTWPTQLEARAVSSDRRLFGYAVEADLAAFHRFSDVVYLSLVGELPTDAQSRAFEIALCFSAPVTVAHAAVHAAVLAKMCGARPAGVLSVSSVILAEEATTLVADANADLERLEAGAITELPASLRAVDEVERASVARLAALVGELVPVPALALDAGRDVALLAVFRACGVTAAFQLAALVALSRLPSALAEASGVAPGSFPAYPIDTPHFEYVEPEQ